MSGTYKRADEVSVTVVERTGRWVTLSVTGSGALKSDGEDWFVPNAAAALLTRNGRGVDRIDLYGPKQVPATGGRPARTLKRVIRQRMFSRDAILKRPPAAAAAVCRVLTGR